MISDTIDSTIATQIAIQLETQMPLTLHDKLAAEGVEIDVKVGILNIFKSTLDLACITS